jgi:hypothetical protein
MMIPSKKILLLCVSHRISLIRRILSLRNVPKIQSPSLFIVVHIPTLDSNIKRYSIQRNNPKIPKSKSEPVIFHFTFRKYTK